MNHSPNPPEWPTAPPTAPVNSWPAPTSLPVARPPTGEENDASWSTAGRVIGILIAAMIGAVVITLVLIWGAFGLTSMLYPETNWDTEGAGLGVVIIFLSCVFLFGPSSFFALVMVGSRRSRNLGQRALPYLGALCFAPSLFVVAVAVREYAGSRGMGWPAPVATIALGGAVVVILAASIDKLSFRLVGVTAIVALVTIALCVGLVHAATEGYRRDERRSDLTAKGMTLFLPSEVPTALGWHVSKMWYWDPTNGAQPGLGPVVELTNDRNTAVKLVRARDATNPICQWLQSQGADCQVLFTTAGGRQVSHGRYGSYFYEIRFDGHYVALSASDPIGDADLSALADTLEVTTPDEWLDRLDAFEEIDDS